jgi:hypothetical protein
MVGSFITEVLWYNIFATNDASSKLGGNPFDNRLRWYYGSTNDRALNIGVKRYTANPAALSALQTYQSSGKLSKPLVTMHTTGDPVVPYWHETLYNAKVMASNSLKKHVNIPILRYGHCNFKVEELLAGFSLMKYMATGELTTFNTAEKTLSAETEKVKFRKLIEEYKNDK